MKLLLLLIPFLFAQLTFAQTTNTNDNLSDYDRNLMKTYDHTGYHNRQMEEGFKEECEAQGKSEKECQNIQRGGDALSGEKFLGLSPTMIKALSKAYSMIIGLGGLGSTLVKEKAETEKKPEDQDKPESGEGTAKTETDSKDDGDTDTEAEEEKSTEDYCRYIVMGTETIATFMQQQESDQIASVPVQDQTAQVQLMYRQKSSHLSRARSVKTQVIGWGAGTACYTAMMTVGPASATNYKNWLKLGATALMWRYYSWEKKTHERAASIVQKVIDKLGVKGDCNPINNRSCYCAQPETQNDTKYCLPQIRDGYLADQYQVSCVTEDLKNDPTCSCANTNTCLDKRIKAGLADIHIPKTLANNLSPYFEMTKGNAREGANEYGLDTNANALNSAASGVLRRSEALLNIPKNKLSKSQLDESKALEEFFPSKVAKTFAASKAPASAKNTLSKFQGASKAIASFGNLNSQNTLSRSPRVRGGSGLDTASSKKKVANPFAKLRRSNSSGKVLKFADRAAKSAQIYKDKGINIFDVVSNRYRKTARKRLDIK